MKSRPPPPPVAAPEPSAPAAQPTFDPLRATLPMVLEIEPRPVDLPSMRATIPMDLGLPKQVEDFFAEQEDDPVELEGVNLGEVDLFKGMPRATLEMLAEKAECMELDADEEVGGFGGALLLAGSAVLCATIVDAAAHWLAPSELIVTQGSLADSMATRVVGAAEGAGVAVWPRDVLDEAFAVLPASSKRARACGDRMQALVGVTMGPFGELEDDQRRALLGELNVTYLRPGEIWLEDGAPAPPLALVGAGEVEIYGPISDDTSEVVEPGALVFPELAGVGGEATTSARAGSHGALLLTADRKATERMTEVVPNLAAILRGD